MSQPTAQDAMDVEETQRTEKPVICRGRDESLILAPEEMQEEGGSRPGMDGMDEEAAWTQYGIRARLAIEGWSYSCLQDVHEETSEEDLQDKFSEYGEIKNLHLNLDRRTGRIRTGYALLEYTHLSEAKAAIAHCNGTQLLESTLSVDFAFVQPVENVPIQRDARSESPVQLDPPVSNTHPVQA
ncbi:unnamed protein product [Pneumocystis jirovecii]|uniref:RRM domain-containing protein n=1 Tax=Pneumocystis jirovecii TaxID=42068 RepID=L0PD45_PNEJI|nr:unnamed protein product [Pneumocystis jirovecii]